MSNEGKEVTRTLPQLDKLTTTNENLKDAVTSALKKGELVEQAIEAKASAVAELQTQKSVYKAISGAKDVEAVEKIVKGLGDDAAKFAETLSLDGLTKVPDFADTLKAVELSEKTLVAQHTEKLNTLVSDFNKSIKGLSIEGVSAMKLDDVAATATTKASALVDGVAKSAGEGRKFSAIILKGEAGLEKAGLPNFKSFSEAKEAGKLSEAISRPKLAIGAAAVALGASMLMNGKNKDQFKEFDQSAQRA